MRSFLIIAAAVSAVVADIDPRLCGGEGGCSIAQTIKYPYRCPDGTFYNIRQSLEDAPAVMRGEYEYATKEEFPKCINGGAPASTDTLVYRKTIDNQKIYYYASGTCNEVDIADDCYSSFKNEHLFTLCNVIESSGKACVDNPLAGKCESFGRCPGWTPDQVEEPCNYNSGSNSCR